MVNSKGKLLPAVASLVIRIFASVQVASWKEKAAQHSDWLS